MCAVEISQWTQAIHDHGVTWTHEGSDSSGWVDAMIEAKYPQASWGPAIEACGRIQQVYQFRLAAQALVSAGYGGDLGDMPPTDPERVLEGRRNTLLSFWVNLGPVEFLTTRFMEQSLAVAQIAVLKSAAYVVDGVIQWPHLEWNGTAWWAVGVLRAEKERTAELVTTPVFHLA